MYKNKKSFSYFFEEKDDEFLALTKYCEWGNCQKKGEYKAPTSREKLREFKWFCLEHVKLYNKGWDYFKGRTSDEIYNEISKDAVWHRPTWEKIKRYKFLNSHLFNGENIDFSGSKAEDKIRKTDIENCAEILEVKLPIKIAALKKQYKKMVKKFHPDVSKNNNEEHIIKLNYAYSELLNFLKR